VVPDLSFYAPTLQVPRADRDRYGCSQLLFFYRNVFLTYAQHINHFSGPSLTRYLAAFGLQTLQVANVANIWVLAAPAAAGDDSFAYPDLVKYHSAMIDHYERMLAGMRRAIVDKLQGRRLVCYGAGRDFGYSQDVFRPLGIEALAVADDTVMSPRVHGVPCVRPEALASFEPEICLATSYDYEHEIAKKARRVLPESTEVLTLTELMYEAEWTMPRFTNYMLKPALEPCTPVRS